MDIDEAAAIVAGPRCPEWGDALQALVHYVETEARTLRATASDAADIAQDVILKVMRRRQSGEEAWSSGGHRGYLKRCAYYGVITLYRQRRKAGTPLPEEVPEQPPEKSNELGGRLRELIDQAASFARNQRKPRYREEFDEAWRELQAIVYDEVSLDAILAAKLNAGADKAAQVRARNNAYKAHERTRTELLQAVGQLLVADELTTAEADLTRRALGIFVRCQRRQASTVTMEKGSP